MEKMSKFSSLCHTCGLSEPDISNRVSLERHIQAHDKENQHWCTTCGKYFPPYIIWKNMSETIIHWSIPFCNVIRLLAVKGIETDI